MEKSKYDAFEGKRNELIFENILINMFRQINRFKALIIILIVFILISTYLSIVVNSSVEKFNGIKIVLDAGHGGRDGGSVGVDGTIEKHINLEYVNALKDVLIENGYMVELTRKNDDGLYSEFAQNKKLSDMNNRFKIIKNANPNLVISIHMNSYTSSSARGAIAYYRKGDSSGERCADLIQKALHNDCSSKINKSKVGDFYMLNCSYYTAVLIECGFLSNPEEERLLNDENYKKKLVNAIFKGILLYFGNNQI